MTTLIQISAEWCAPCKRMRPVAEAACEAAGAEYRYADIEGEDAAPYAESVTSVPTFIVLKDGEEVERFIGTKSEQWIIDTLSEHK